MCCKYYVLVVVSLVFISHAHGATIKANAPTRLTRRLPENDEYSTVYARRSLNSITYATPAVQSIETFNTQPQLADVVPTVQTSAYQHLNSYQPPASGTVSYRYAQPKARQSLTLPAQPLPALSATANGRTAPTTALLMIEEPTTTTVLTKQQNETLQAAQIIASSLLQATGSAPLKVAHQTQVSDNVADLNTTDLVVLKAQKNAYIIPTALTKEAHNPALAQELYRMRENLQKAFTVNQFIFIIKPEKINFLNKLV